MEIFDVEGNKVAEEQRELLNHYHPNLGVKLAGTPYLYRAVFTFGEDIYEETFGIRTVKMKGTQFTS